MRIQRHVRMWCVAWRAPRPRALRGRLAQQASRRRDGLYSSSCRRFGRGQRGLWHSAQPTGDRPCGEEANRARTVQQVADGSTGSAGAPSTGSAVSGGEPAASSTTGRAVANRRPAGSPAAGDVRSVHDRCGRASERAAGSTIDLGNVGSYGGVIGAVFAGAKRPLAIWQDYINAHGGLNGHPVHIYFADDGGRPFDERVRGRTRGDAGPRHCLRGQLLSADSERQRAVSARSRTSRSSAATPTPMRGGRVRCSSLRAPAP